MDNGEWAKYEQSVAVVSVLTNHLCKQYWMGNARLSNSVNSFVPVVNLFKL